MLEENVVECEVEKYAHKDPVDILGETFLRRRNVHDLFDFLRIFPALNALSSVFTFSRGNPLGAATGG